MTPPAKAHHPAVEFDSAVQAVMLERLEGRIAAAESTGTQAIQNMNGTMQAMQADVQRIDQRSIENNALLHAVSERTTGFERLAKAIEETGKGHAGTATNVSLELAGMRGFIRGVVLCGAVGFGSLGAFVVYRMDKTDDALSALREVIRIYHPTAVETIGSPHR